MYEEGFFYTIVISFQYLRGILSIPGALFALRPFSAASISSRDDGSTPASVSFDCGILPSDAAHLLVLGRIGSGDRESTVVIFCSPLFSADLYVTHSFFLVRIQSLSFSPLW